MPNTPLTIKILLALLGLALVLPHDLVSNFCGFWVWGVLSGFIFMDLHSKEKSHDED
jgi:hypothetical protein